MMNGKPLVIDGYCGLGGWADGFLAEGWECVGIDVERHDYGKGGYPGHLILQDMLTVHGKQFKDAECLVFSPPCQFFSYCAMPWSRAKKLAAEVRADPIRLEKELALFKACFRIQREAIEAAGHFIPMVVENVRGAQPWVGRARWAFGSFYLWGDVPALMPITMPRRKSKVGSWDTTRANYNPDKTWDEGLKLPGNNSPRRWDEREVQRLCDAPTEGFKTAGMNWSDQTLRGQDFTRIAGLQAEGFRKISEAHRSKSPAKGYGVVTEDGIKSDNSGWRENGCLESCNRMVPNKVENDGVKGFTPNGEPMGRNQGPRQHGSKSNARKAASATIAKIPFTLARWIAKVYKPK